MNRSAIVAVACAGALAASAAQPADRSHGEARQALDNRRAALLDGFAAQLRPLKQDLRRLEPGGLSPQALIAAQPTDAPREETARIRRLLDPFVTIYPETDSSAVTLAQARALADAVRERRTAADDAVDGPNADNAAIPAGYTFLGQFIAHDVTLADVRVIERVEPLRTASLTPQALVAAVETVVENQRSAALDLDSIYGLTLADMAALLDDIGERPLCGPGAAGDCFATDHPLTTVRTTLALLELDDHARPTGRLRLQARAISPEDGRVALDLPRCGDGPRLAAAPTCQVGPGETLADVVGRAVIGDDRNDENLVIARIQVLFIEAHNRLFNEALATLDATDAATQAGRRAAMVSARSRLTRHWQAIVLDDFLARSIGRDRAEALKTAPMRFYTEGDGLPYCEVLPGAIPHEFSVAAFRFGHSQPRGGYAVVRGEPGLGFAQMFGARPMPPNRNVEPVLFFDNVIDRNPPAAPPAAPLPQESKAIDTVLSLPLASLLLPSIPAGNVGDPNLGSLPHINAARNADAPTQPTPPSTGPALQPIPLLRGLEVAGRLADAGAEVSPLTDADVAATAMAANLPGPGPVFPDGVGAADLTLWFYVLTEAEVQQGGVRLGDVGGLIVGETLTGLVRCDAAGILGDAPLTPDIAAPEGLSEPGRFTMGDLINFVSAPAPAPAE